MNSRIIGHAWITGLDTIGVIVTKDDVTGEYKSRILHVPGNDMAGDLDLIHIHGTKIPLICGVDLVSTMGVWYEKIPPVDIWRQTSKYGQY